MFSLVLGMMIFLGAVSGRLSLILVHNTIAVAVLGMLLMAVGTYQLWLRRRRCAATAAVS